VGGLASNTCLVQMMPVSPPHGAVKYQGTPTHPHTCPHMEGEDGGCEWVGGVNRMHEGKGGDVVDTSF